MRLWTISVPRSNLFILLTCSSPSVCRDVAVSMFCAVIRLEIRSEFECCDKAFFLLANGLSRSQLLEPFCDEALSSAVEDTKRANLILSLFGETNVTEMQLDELRESAGGPPVADGLVKPKVDIPLFQAEPNAFPCLVVIVGSCYFSLRVS